MEKGYFQVYTGNGKGKTTAALGMAFRALGHGLTVYIGQFMKGQDYGELKSARKFPALTIERFGEERFILNDGRIDERAARLAEAGLQRGSEALLSGKFDLVILDEINVALYFKLLDLGNVVALIKAKPAGTELVFTGRNAPGEILELADLVTEMKEVKHYFQQGIQARIGIEK
ncbi:MAG: cob(I)yrinic acid a,c-diamide adenosyltransferase [Candidatus Wallbacteria bacterium]|nr:cob(I)yrinic acid a,c-diamide adenosyltransferase [Candidatus Wallbacteria bacterium]